VIVDYRTNRIKLVDFGSCAFYSDENMFHTFVGTLDYAVRWLLPIFLLSLLKKKIIQMLIWKPKTPKEKREKKPPK
jgi:serine/threonine protein kinase